MWTLGETLRQARLDKGVSLADAARETRIRRAYLEALESEDPAALPAAVYTRGLLKTYAEYLGLNAQSMLDLYQPGARRETGPPLRAAVPRVAIPRQIPIRPVLYGIGGIVFIVLLGFGWNLYQDVQQSLRAADSTAIRPRQGTPTPTGARLPTAIPVALAAASPSPSPTQEPPPTPAPTSTPPIDGILVEFRTSGRVYVEAAVDGKQVLAETLAPGTQRSLPLASSNVIMRVSNPSLVDVTVNNVHQDPQTGTNPMELSWRR
ncbi:MAG: helix-turn-helix domain-containing protein [Chloroflexi bacterium]|nr:helix-turn-helix domain-containing protein [Chloroflexota bacterium]MBV9544289.1 helix-turn-helix domain-containing protein [Chloroflexota bacterium]